jgi:hypothetical protein
MLTSMKTMMVAVLMMVGCGVPPGAPSLPVSDGGFVPECDGCYGSPCNLRGDCTPQNICVRTFETSGVCCFLYTGGAICPNSAGR